MSTFTTPEHTTTPDRVYLHTNTLHTVQQQQQHQHQEDQQHQQHQRHQQQQLPSQSIEQQSGQQLTDHHTGQHYTTGQYHTGQHTGQHNGQCCNWGHKANFIFGIVTWGVGILEINYNLGFGIFLLCFGGLIVLFEIVCGYGLLKHLNM